VLLAGVLGALLFLTAIGYEQSILEQSEHSAEFRETDRFLEFCDLFEEGTIAEEHLYIATGGFWNDFPTVRDPGGPDRLLLTLTDGAVLTYFLLSLFAAIVWNSLLSSDCVFRNSGLLFFISGILGYGIGHLLLYSSTDLIGMPITWGARSFQQGALLLGMLLCIAYCVIDLLNGSRYGAKLKSINPMIVHFTLAVMILGFGVGTFVSTISSVAQLQMKSGSGASTSYCL
jgi:hypothetical protein